jgi:hypothetical protein
MVCRHMYVPLDYGRGQLVHGSDTLVLAPGAALNALQALGGDVLRAATVSVPGRLLGNR